MGRAIFGVIVGAVVLIIIVMGASAVAYVALGADGSYKEGVWDPSTTWIVLDLVIAAVAAVSGGAACAVIAARGSRAAIVLAVLILIVGGLTALWEIQKPDPTEPNVRPSEITMTDAMMNARPVALSLVMHPVLGCAGVLLGAKLTGRGRRRDATTGIQPS